MRQDDVVGPLEGRPSTSTALSPEEVLRDFLKRHWACRLTFTRLLHAICTPRRCRCFLLRTTCSFSAYKYAVLMKYPDIAPAIVFGGNIAWQLV